MEASNQTLPKRTRTTHNSMTLRPSDHSGLFQQPPLRSAPSRSTPPTSNRDQKFETDPPLFVNARHVSLIPLPGAPTTPQQLHDLREFLSVGRIPAETPLQHPLSLAPATKQHPMSSPMTVTSSPHRLYSPLPAPIPIRHSRPPTLP